MRIVLPEVINAAGLLPFVAILGTIPDFETEIILDFSRLRRVSPAGLTVLAAAVDRWRNRRGRVRVDGLRECTILGYLQRMDVLAACGIDLPDTFHRHNSAGRFMPVTRIVDVDAMSRDVAACIAPGGEDFEHLLAPVYDLSAYVLGELGANVRQHSRGAGFVAAQTNHREGLVRLAVADNGIGVRQSFIDVGLSWSVGLSDSAALRRALEPRVSSKGKPINEGVGLTLVSTLARLASAWLLITSGAGFIRMNPDGALQDGAVPDAGVCRGTLVAITFRRDKLRDFATLLDRAKQEAGLLVKRPIKSTFT